MFMNDIKLKFHSEYYNPFEITCSYEQIMKSEYIKLLIEWNKINLNLNDHININIGNFKPKDVINVFKILCDDENIKRLVSGLSIEEFINVINILSFFLLNDDIMNEVFYELYATKLVFADEEGKKYIDNIIINPGIDLKYKRGLLSMIGNNYPLNEYDKNLIPSRLYPSESYYDEYNHLLILRSYDPIYLKFIFEVQGIHKKKNAILLIIRNINNKYFELLDKIVHTLLENINIYLYSFVGDPILADISNYYIEIYRRKYSNFDIMIFIETKNNLKNDLKNTEFVEMIINPDPIIKTIYS